jgi:hypothetical protein
LIANDERAVQEEADGKDLPKEVFEEEDFREYFLRGDRATRSG